MNRLVRAALVDGLARGIVLRERVEGAVRPAWGSWRRRRAFVPGRDDRPRMLGRDVLSWTCHVCGDERPDPMIAVLSGWIDYRTGRRAMREPADLAGWMQANVRFCRDRPSCARGASVKLERWLDDTADPRAAPPKGRDARRASRR